MRATPSPGTVTHQPTRREGIIINTLLAVRIPDAGSRLSPHTHVIGNTVTANAAAVSPGEQSVRPDQAQCRQRQRAHAFPSNGIGAKWAGSRTATPFDLGPGNTASGNGGGRLQVPAPATGHHDQGNTAVPTTFLNDGSFNCNDTRQLHANAWSNKHLTNG